MAYQNYFDKPFKIHTCRYRPQCPQSLPLLFTDTILRSRYSMFFLYPVVGWIMCISQNFNVAKASHNSRSCAEHVHRCTFLPAISQEVVGLNWIEILFTIMASDRPQAPTHSTSTHPSPAGCHVCHIRPLIGMRIVLLNWVQWRRIVKSTNGKQEFSYHSNTNAYGNISDQNINYLHWLPHMLLKGPSQPVCFVVACCCFHLGNSISHGATVCHTCTFEIVLTCVV